MQIAPRSLKGILRISLASLARDREISGHTNHVSTGRPGRKTCSGPLGWRVGLFLCTVGKASLPGHRPAFAPPPRCFQPRSRSRKDRPRHRQSRCPPSIRPRWRAQGRFVSSAIAVRSPTASTATRGAADQCPLGGEPRWRRCCPRQPPRIGPATASSPVGGFPAIASRDDRASIPLPMVRDPFPPERPDRDETARTGEDPRRGNARNRAAAGWLCVAEDHSALNRRTCGRTCRDVPPPFDFRPRAS